MAARTRRVDAGDRNVLASARIRTRAGRWVVVRGSLAGPDQVVILLEAAGRAGRGDHRCLRLHRARADDHQARGLSTAEIAGRLHLSAYTVQDHLKGIFDKSGTSSRVQLVSRLFLDHDVP